jgi:hypothetical protein
MLAFGIIVRYIPIRASRCGPVCEKGVLWRGETALQKGKAQARTWASLNWGGKEVKTSMATHKVVVPSMVGYVPPAGYRVVSYLKLEDGTYEATLEPLVLPSGTSGMGSAPTGPIPVTIVILVCTMLSTIKNGVLE